MAHDETNFSSKRLGLHALRPDDATAITAALQNWKVLSMLSAPPHPYRPADAESFIADRMVKGNTPADCVYGIILDGQIVGIIGIEPNDRGASTLGYWLAEAHWGKGLMSEAANAIVAHYFEASDAAEILSAAFVENPASIRVQEKIGFTSVGKTELFSRSRAMMMDSVATKLTQDAFERQRLQ